MDAYSFTQFSKGKCISSVIFNFYVSNIEFWGDQNSDNIEFKAKYKLLWGKLESINASALYDIETMGNELFVKNKIWEMKYKDAAEEAVGIINTFVINYNDN